MKKTDSTKIMSQSATKMIKQAQVTLKNHHFDLYDTNQLKNIIHSIRKFQHNLPVNAINTKNVLIVCDEVPVSNEFPYLAVEKDREATNGTIKGIDEIRCNKHNLLTEPEYWFTNKECAKLEKKMDTRFTHLTKVPLSHAHQELKEANGVDV